MRHVAPLSPVASVDCAYFLSPPGVCGPPALSGHSSLANSPLAPVLLFSYSYKPLFPQLLSFHIHTKPPGSVGVRPSATFQPTFRCLERRGRARGFLARAANRRRALPAARS